MDDLDSGLLQINLNSDIINDLYEIIYGDIVKSNQPATTFGNYALLENYKANYLLYNNSLGLFGVATVSEKTTKVINYIDRLLTQLKTQPDFWDKLAVGIRKQSTIFTSDIVDYFAVDNTNGATFVYTKLSPNQDYRVYDINAQSSISNAGSKVKTLAYKSTLVGYIDPTIFGGLTQTLVINDSIEVFDDDNIVQDKYTSKLVSKKIKYKEVQRRNGYYSQKDLKLLLTPDFLSKTFKGGLYANIEKVGYKMIANFQDTK
ncbi:MAG: hypothetical protein V7K21_14175 [Nostoc sp.]|uniref:hypothetical protein n=1 Tax=Nostoc sp. TaxID=1180 RepID=UPI002FF6B87E